MMSSPVGLRHSLITLLAAFASPASSLSNWTQWTCDELTPPLCNLSLTTGHVQVRGTKIKFWRYRRKESLLSSGHSILPIIVLHGGPSWPHNYMLPLRQLACHGTNEVIFYDQAGCGESKLMRDGANITMNYSHLLDPVYYSEEELPALIRHLSLGQYHILGHSWGTIVAQLFALNAKDTSGLVSLILSGPLSDAQNYIEAQWDDTEGNLGSLPPFVQSRIHDLEQMGEYDSAEYQAISDVLTTRFTLRTAPAPDCFTESFKGLNFEIYMGMQGASEFTMSGVLGSMNLTARLPEIDVPTLLTSGRFDTMRPPIVKTMQRQIKLSERKLLPHSGHVSMIDDAELMTEVVADFLERIEDSLWQGRPFEPKMWEEEDVVLAKSFPRWLVVVLTYILAFFAGAIVGRCRIFSLKRYTPID